MPDRRHHRGRNPEDDRLFAIDQWPRLRLAVSDLSWLLSRGYASPSALKIVGDRYELEQRQRMAVARCACSDQARLARRQRQVEIAAVEGRRLEIDGFNVLLTIEAALSRGVLLLARDGCLRDIASVHGTYRQVDETTPAILQIAEKLDDWQPSLCVWYLDAPVSNSGRLAQQLRSLGESRRTPWEVQLVNSPDQVLRRSEGIVATADSAVLDHCLAWLNLTRAVLGEAQVKASAIDLSGDPVGQGLP
jgi:hypothetical protein